MLLWGQGNTGGGGCPSKNLPHISPSMKSPLSLGRFRAQICPKKPRGKQNGTKGVFY